MKKLAIRTRGEWRRWLQDYHASEREIWLVFHKRHTGVECLSYEDSVEEALCFGWIDSLVKRLDEDRYARKFTPRGSNSRWSTINRRRYERMKMEGLLAPAGLARPPTSRSGDVPRPATALPSYIEERLRAHPRAWEHFQQLAPSYRRNYIAWIDSAKRPATKEKRLREAVDLLNAGEKPGPK